MQEWDLGGGSCLKMRAVHFAISRYEDLSSLDIGVIRSGRFRRSSANMG